MAVDTTAVPTLIKQAEQFLAKQDYQKALDLYDLCLAVNPDDPHLRYCTASLYSELYKSGIAISILKSVVKDVPNHAQAWNNLGIAYKNSAQWDKALEAYTKALELNYDPLTIVNLSGLYINNGTPDMALKWAEKGLKLAPQTPQLRNHRALAMLEMGNFKEGFPAYDARFDLPGWSARHYDAPIWKGQNVKRLVIHGEQGLGDEILFMQAFDRVLLRAEEVVVECAKRLVPTFSRCFKVPCYGSEDELKAGEKKKYDAWIPMGSLFGVVGWDEHKTAYLSAAKPYPRTDKFRIGLSWRGGTIQTHEHLRNFDLGLWAQLLQHDAEFVSVQYGPAAGMAQKLGIAHDQATIDDIEGLMSLIASCDLIISVCNSTVHMSAALGVPCWCLTPNKPAWRYGMTGDKMPWYQSVTMIRQTGTWQDVINETRRRLADIGIVQRAERAVA